MTVDSAGKLLICSPVMFTADARSVVSIFLDDYYGPREGCESCRVKVQKLREHLAASASAVNNK